MLIVSKTKLVGKRYLEATKYRFEYSPDIIPRELNIDGIK
jgi:hypothetical protein